METNRLNDAGQMNRVAFCQFCGNSISDGSIVCPSCGNRLDFANDNGLSLAAMIFGTIGLVLCWLPFFGFLISAVGVGFAIPAANKQQRLYEWALVLSLLGAMLGLILSFTEPML